MSAVEKRLAEWFLIAAELLRYPIVELPLEQMREPILRSFDADMFTFNTRAEHGTPTATGFGWNTPGSLQVDVGIPRFFEQADVRILDHHPLIQWYAATGQAVPMSLARVPRSFSSSWQARELVDLIRGFGVRAELSIPLLVNGLQHQAVVVSRSADTDFSEDDLQLSRGLQPMLVALQRQADLLASRAIPAEVADILSGRELAVLVCSAKGMTAHAVGFELSISPRTVEKHLENVYRKLGVRDKVSAALMARELGLVDSGLTRANFRLERSYPQYDR